MIEHVIYTDTDGAVFKVNEDGIVILKDSGSRTKFASGAVRDIQQGKGRCDLLPLDVIGELIFAEELRSIEMFKVTKDLEHLYTAISDFCKTTHIDIYTLILEVSKHFESGALKYGENNWKLGMPLHCYLSSGVRHFIQYKRGDTDEPHDLAFAWNIICAIWTYSHKPELDDVEPNTEEEV